MIRLPGSAEVPRVGTRENPIKYLGPVQDGHLLLSYSRVCKHGVQLILQHFEDDCLGLCIRGLSLP